MPVSKIRRRYLSFKMISDGRFASKDIMDVIQKGVQKLYGINGLSLVSPSLIEFDEAKQVGIVGCRHIRLRMMRASLAFITEIGGYKTSILVNRVSGTIKSLKQHQ